MRESLQPRTWARRRPLRDVDEMTAEIEKAKLSEIETLMTKDLLPIPPSLSCGSISRGPKPVLRITSMRKPTSRRLLTSQLKTDPPRPEVVGAAEAGLGEVYARTLMVDEANAAFDAAAKADPPNAARYFRDQAVIFYNAETSPRKSMPPTKPSRPIRTRPFFTTSRPRACRGRPRRS